MLPGACVAKTLDVYCIIYGGSKERPVPVLRHSFTVPGVDAGSARLVTDILRLAADKTLEWFQKNYMPLRFTWYAKDRLGWAVTIKHNMRKQRKARESSFEDAKLPNVFSGDMRKDNLGLGRSISAVGGATSMRVRARAGSVSKPNAVSQGCMQKVTPDEAMRMARMFEGVVIALANNLKTESYATRHGKIKTRSVISDLDAGTLAATFRGRKLGQISTDAVARA